jgi:hypothetical protein
LRPAAARNPQPKENGGSRCKKVPANRQEFFIWWRKGIPKWGKVV